MKPSDCPPDGSTFGQLLSWASQALAAASNTARLDAKVLLRHAGQLTDIELITWADQPADDKTRHLYADLIHQRSAGMPVAYLTGHKEFWSLNFKVTPDTLIPRPETELLVETALSLIPTTGNHDIAELGTGSGAIACALAKERPQASIIATDRSPQALNIARQNARIHNLGNIQFKHSDWFTQLAGKKFDLIVCNPPYVNANDENLCRGDVRFEPKQALTPGTDGLKAIALIISQARDFLTCGGYLLLEHGYNQQAAVTAAFRAHQFAHIICLRDLNNQPRVCFARAR